MAHVVGEASFSHGGVIAEHHLPDASAGRVAIIVSRFNAPVTDLLFAGAVATLLEHGVAHAQIDAVQVPGAVELPLAAHTHAATGRYGAIVVLGCVIRGETAHFDYVCRAATDGIMRVQLDHGVPVGFGVLTVETEQQARDRAGAPGTGLRNAGSDAAIAALELSAVLRTHEV